ncbi:peptidoglycan-binding protein [Streptomyces sp. NBC_00879]|nr:peptidoglycan-binding protein [Streptomyces sp. NBC_00879]
MPHAPGAPSTPAQSRAGSDSAAAWQHPSAGTAFEKGNHGTASPSTRSGDNNPIEDPPDPPVLRQGDSGPEVVELQKRLRQSLCLCYLRGDVDGTYDSRVKSAVWSYQSIRGVHGDPQGVYGPNTRRALEAETSSPR